MSLGGGSHRGWDPQEERILGEGGSLGEVITQRMESLGRVVTWRMEVPGREVLRRD